MRSTDLRVSASLVSGRRKLRAVIAAGAAWHSSSNDTAAKKNHRPTASGGPEQVGVFLGAGTTQHPVGGHHVERFDVEGAHRPPLAEVDAQSAPQQEAAQADGTAVAGGETQAIGCERTAQIATGNSGADDSALTLRIDRQRAQRRQIEKHSVPTNEGVGEAMASAAECHSKSMLAASPYDCDHVIDRTGANDVVGTSINVSFIPACPA
ncbi:hypothetical protein V2J18_00435 [Lysobacter firmicutimachus]|uniref:Uncharacterized protein n=1 Tax=Lysobacter firmicutimachus TaxID=1792846 RepID=A0ABU8CWJ0_9GAMM